MGATTGTPGCVILFGSSEDGSSKDPAGAVCAAAGTFERADVPGAGHQACETDGTSVAASAGVRLPEARFPAAETGTPV